jgi:hypothetical protein
VGTLLIAQRGERLGDVAEIAFGLLAERFVNRGNGQSILIGECLSVPNPPPLN